MWQSANESCVRRSGSDFAGAHVPHELLPCRPLPWTIAGMKTRRGKWMAVATIVLGFAVLGLAKDQIAEKYYVWKLKSGDLRERADAAADLKEMGPKAVPALLNTIAEDFDPDSPRVWCGNCKSASRWYLASRALEGMGKAAIPALREALQDQDPGVRHFAADALKKIQGE